MEFDNPLDPIWQAFEVTRDCLKVAQRTVNRSDTYLLKATQFIGNSKQESSEWIKKSRNESEEFIILSLWVTFERIIISYLQDKGKRICEEPPVTFSRNLYKKFEIELEYWRAEDVLGLFKGIIDGHLIGGAKNIKKYRDWIVHRNPNRPTPEKVTPLFTYKILSSILLEIKELSS